MLLKKKRLERLSKQIARSMRSFKANSPRFKSCYVIDLATWKRVQKRSDNLW